MQIQSHNLLSENLDNLLALNIIYIRSGIHLLKESNILERRQQIAIPKKNRGEFHWQKEWQITDQHLIWPYAWFLGIHKWEIIGVHKWELILFKDSFKERSENDRSSFKTGYNYQCMEMRTNTVFRKTIIRSWQKIRLRPLLPILFHNLK